jgi:hypothetical protein
VRIVASLVACGVVSLQVCKVPNPDLVGGFKHVQTIFIVIPIWNDDPN